MPDFDKLAQDYHRREILLGDHLSPWLEENLPGGGTALDLTCGSGRHSKIIGMFYDHVAASDLSPEMVRLAQKHNPAGNITYEVEDLFHCTGQYDLVFSSAALHDLPNLDDALEHIKSLVKPGGTALIADMTAKHSAKPWLYYRWAPLVWLFVDLCRRPPKMAWEIYRLCVEPNWVRHLAEDRYLTREEFEERYAEHFPGATFTAVGRKHVCRWTRPAE